MRHQGNPFIPRPDETKIRTWRRAAVAIAATAITLLVYVAAFRTGAPEAINIVRVVTASRPASIPAPVAVERASVRSAPFALSEVLSVRRDPADPSVVELTAPSGESRSFAVGEIVSGTYRLREVTQESAVIVDDLGTTMFLPIATGGPQPVADEPSQAALECRTPEC